MSPSRRKKNRRASLPNPWYGSVGEVEVKVSARTKTEAITKLRVAFRERGIKTQPEGMVDLLEGVTT